MAVCKKSQPKPKWDGRYNCKNKQGQRKSDALQQHAGYDKNILRINGYVLILCNIFVCVDLIAVHRAGFLSRPVKVNRQLAVLFNQVEADDLIHDQRVHSARLEVKESSGVIAIGADKLAESGGNFRL